MKKLPLGVIIYFLLFLVFSSISSFTVQQAHAAINAVTNASDVITTSRPSAAAPIDHATGDITSGSIVTLGEGSLASGNQSRFLASDSAKLDLESLNGPDGIKSGAGNMIVASQSADLKSVYLTSSVPTTLNKDIGVFEVPITASHSVTFTTVSQIPANGFVRLTFPAPSGLDSHNYASPSSSTFQFNNLAVSQINVTSTPANWNTSISGSSITNSTAVILLKTTAVVPGGSVISIGLPNLINPTTAQAVSGGVLNSDQWKVKIQTEDASNNILDGPTNVVVNTLAAITVTATVDSTFTMTIQGQTGTICGDSSVGTTGGMAAPSATAVDLGFITSSAINITSQLITITTNAGNGYSITATSSGHLIDGANGAFFPDANTGNSGLGLNGNNSPAPAAITAGTAAFGIHPCTAASGGANVAAIWGASNGTAGGSGNKYANPWNAYNSGNIYTYTLSSYPSNPPAAATTTYVEYAATASSTTPSGTYSTAYTFVGTPTF